MESFAAFTCILQTGVVFLILGAQLLVPRMVLIQRLTVEQQILQVLENLLISGRECLIVGTSSQDALESCLLSWGQMVQVGVSQVKRLAVDDLILQVFRALFLLWA